MNSWTAITSMILLMRTMLPSLRLISSNQCLCCSTGFKLSWPKTKPQNVGADDPSFDNPHRSRLSRCPSHDWSSTARVAYHAGA